MAWSKIASPVQVIKQCLLTVMGVPTALLAFGVRSVEANTDLSDRMNAATRWGTVISEEEVRPGKKQSVSNEETQYLAPEVSPPVRENYPSGSASEAASPRPKTEGAVGGQPGTTKVHASRQGRLPPVLQMSFVEALKILETIDQGGGASISDEKFRGAMVAALSADHSGVGRSHGQTVLRYVSEFFGMYAERAWFQEVSTLLLKQYGVHVLQNSDSFSDINKDFTRYVIGEMASEFPVEFFTRLPEFAKKDGAWARVFVEGLLRLAPEHALSYVEYLVATNGAWAKKLVTEVVTENPKIGILNPAAYVDYKSSVPTPWGKDLFVSCVRANPIYAMELVTGGKPGILKYLRNSDDGVLSVLHYIAGLSSFDQLGPGKVRDMKIRLATFAHELAGKESSERNKALESYAHLVERDGIYIHKVLEMKKEIAQSLEESPEDQGVRIKRQAIDAALEQAAGYYIDTFNELHDSHDKVRFSKAEGMSAESMYIVLAYGGRDIFTSSFLGVYSRLLAKLTATNSNLEQLVYQAYYANISGFIQSAAAFGKLPEVMKMLSSESKKFIFETVIGNVGRQNKIFDHAVAVAEIISSLTPQEFPEVIKHLEAGYLRANEGSNAQLLFGVLAAQFASVHGQQNMGSLATIASRFQTTLPDLSQISGAGLFENGVHIQRLHFYPDEDGDSSFSRFMQEYSQDRNWQIDEFSGYTRITGGRKGRQIQIYANQPRAGNAGRQALRAYTRSAQVVIHRGHSYHVDQTISSLSNQASNSDLGSTSLIYLGSCGSTRDLTNVLRKSHRAQVVSTRGMGTMNINDPLLKAINEEMLDHGQINWSRLATKLPNRITKDKRFADYLFPDRNVGLQLLQAYLSQRSIH